MITKSSTDSIKEGDLVKKHPFIVVLPFEKMDKIVKILLSLFCAVCCASAFKIRSDEEIRNRENMLRNSDNFTELFSRDYLKFKDTGIRTHQLEQMLAMIKIPIEFGRVEMQELDAAPAIMSCLACRATVGLLLQQYRSGARDREQIIQESITICLELTAYSIIVCEGVIRAFAVSYNQF